MIEERQVRQNCSMKYILINLSLHKLLPSKYQPSYSMREQRTFIRPKRKTERCKNSFLLSYVLALLRKPGNSIHEKKQREPNAVLRNKIISCYLPVFPAEIRSDVSSLQYCLLVNLLSSSCLLILYIVLYLSINFNTKKQNSPR